MPQVIRDVLIQQVLSVTDTIYLLVILISPLARSSGSASYAANFLTQGTLAALLRSLTEGFGFPKSDIRETTTEGLLPPLPPEPTTDAAKFY